MYNFINDVKFTKLYN